MSDDNYRNPECAEAVRAALANSDACWRMEQEVLQRKLDEAVTARQLERNLASNWMTRAEEADRHRKELKVALANTEAERDVALSQVARREREHEALLETAQKALANTEAERDRACQACNACWHDLSRIGSLCEQTADEYPLKAVERTIKQFQEVIKQRDEARAEVKLLMNHKGKA